MEIRFIDPATDFSDGLAVIRAYHDDLLQQGRRLLALIEDIETRGIDAGRAERLAQAYAHHQRATQLHHLDEEKALFPAVASRDPLVDGMIERLALDHEEIEEAWRVLEIALREVLAHHRVPAQVSAKAGRFETLLREHLLREDTDFLPRLTDLLSPAQRRAMGGTMAALRGRAPDTGPSPDQSR